MKYIPRGEGYFASDPDRAPRLWFIAGGLGYLKDGRAYASVHLVVLRRFYFLLWEATAQPFNLARGNRMYKRISREMASVVGDPTDRADSIMVDDDVTRR